MRPWPRRSFPPPCRYIQRRVASTCESCAAVEFFIASCWHVSLVRSFMFCCIGVSGGCTAAGRSESRRPSAAASSSSPSGACSCARTLSTCSRSSAKRAGRRTCHEAFCLASSRAPSSRPELARATCSMRIVAGSSRASPSCSATSVATSERHSNDATQSITLRDACLLEACSRSSVSRTTSSAVALPRPTHSSHTSQWVVHSAGDRQISMPSMTACTAGSIARESSCKPQPASSIGRCWGSCVSSPTSASSRSWIGVQ